MSADKKVATVTTNKMKYTSKYVVTITGLSEENLVEEFTSKGVTDAWTLKINAPTKIKADGISTGEVTFELLGEDGEIDTEANDIVLDLNATFGNLSQKRLTLQNGVGKVVLRSEFHENEVISKIDAQVIDGSEDYKDLIGVIVAKPIYVVFNHEGTNGGEETIIKSLVSVNSNEADRVTLIFDEDITNEDIYEFDASKNIKINAGMPVLLNNITVTQKDGATEESKAIKGIEVSSKNPKALIVYLDVRNLDGTLKSANILKDNKDVDVKAKIGEYGRDIDKSFKLTDARVANLTGTRTINNNKLEVSFTEGISEVDFVIDGKFDNSTFARKYGDITWNSKTKKYEDNRNKVVLTLNNTYEESKDGDIEYTPGYFKAGKHSIQASTIKDYAAQSDNKNIGTTQSLTFNVDEDNSQLEVTQAVDSPEQFRVKFTKNVAFKDAKTFAETAVFSYKTVVDGKVVWEPVAKNIGSDKHFKSTSEVTANDLLKITTLPATDAEATEYLIELKADWTRIYNTEVTNDNYYNDEFAMVMPIETVKNAANGKDNKEAIVLNLTQATVLATPDLKSPEIATNGIKKYENGFDPENGGGFNVTMSEPVKLYKLVDGTYNTEGSTLAQKQASLPETKVEFIGKDKDGKTRTLAGTVLGFGDDLDKVIQVKWSEDEDTTPQKLVNNGGSTEWTLAIKSISDDVGNTSATANQKFTLTPDVPRDEYFKVVDTGGNATGQQNDGNFKVKGTKTDSGDTVVIEFTEKVNVVGTGAATDVTYYTLNGKELPAQTSIIKTGTDGAGNEDREITIKLPAGTLGKGANTGVITLASQLQSAKGLEIKGDLAFTFKIADETTLTPAEKEVADGVITTQAGLTQLLATTNKAYTNLTIKMGAIATVTLDGFTITDLNITDYIDADHTVNVNNSTIGTLTVNGVVQP